MENIFTRSKLIVPDIPVNALYSDRIKAMNIADHRAVTVTAPAGYGKTTAVLLSLGELRHNVHWYRLGKEDNSLPVFFTDLIESLFGRDAAELDSIRSMSSIGNISEEYPLLSAVICQDAWAAYSPGAPEKYLVFDDFQYVADNEIICEIVLYLIDNMPPDMHIIVVSRKETLPTEKLMLEGDFLSIGRDDLLFTKDEIETLFSRLEMNSSLYENMDAIYEYTEGWIAVIILLIHTADQLRFENGRILSGNKTTIPGYFLNEVLAGAGSDRVNQIAQISLISEFTVEDLSVVFQIDNPDEIIDWLEGNNLYIQKIGDTPPVYRFHSLFRDALRSFRDQVFSMEEIAEFHYKAAEHFKQTGRYKAAIEQYLLAGDDQKASDLAAWEGQKYMDQGDIDAASELIRTIPESIVQRHATLLMILGGSLLNTQTDLSLTYLEKSLDLAVKEKKIELAINVQGLMISVCAQRSDFRNIKNIVSKVPVARAMMVSRHARNMLLMSLFTKAVVTDNVKMGKVLLNIIDRTKTNGDLWEYSNLITKATLYGVDGDFHEAEDIITRITEHSIALKNDRWRSLGLYICCNLAILMSEKKLSLKLIDDLASIGEKYDSGYSAGSAAFFTGMAKYRERDFEGALEAAKHAEGIFVRNQNHVMAAFARVLSTAWLSEIHEGKDYSERSLEELNTVSALGSYHGLLELAQTVSALQYFNRGDLESSEDLLLQAYKSGKKKHASQSMCGIAIHLARLYNKKDDKRHEMKYLKYFGKTTWKNGYVYMREMNYPSLVWICARCVEKNINTAQMMRIISTYFGPEAVEYLIKKPSDITKDPHSFIARYQDQSALKPKDIRIKLFGSFRLMVDDKQVEDSMWKTRKISGILKYILSRPDQTVSRETLAAAFWPHSNSKASYTSLRVALFELRKTLAALGMAFDSRNALIAEDRRGFCVCYPESVKSDANEFFTLYERSQKDNLSEDDLQILYQQMVELYDGDFFAEESFEDWVEVLREKYRSIYIETANKLAQIYYRKDNISQAELLLFKQMEIDPYNEKACSMLIELYTRAGRQDQASALSRQFIKRFKQEMGVEPDLS